MNPRAARRGSVPTVASSPHAWTLAFALVISALGCADDGAQVVVDLRTDFVAGVEFDRAVVRFDGTEHERGFVASEREHLDHRLTTLETPRGAFPLEVRLLAPNGETVAARDVQVTVDAPSVGATVVISRECRDVMCAEDENCLGGRCVPPSCIRGDEPVCPAPQCRSNEDCGELMTTCAVGVCEFGVCAQRGRGCDAAEYCDPAVGCRVVPPPDGVDAGPSDGGTPDSGRADAGGDAGEDAGGGEDARGPDTGTEDAGMCTPGVDPMCVDCTDLGAWPAAWVAEEEAALTRMNERRAEAGDCDGVPYGVAPALTDHPQLRMIARCHSLDMAENNFFSHSGSDRRSAADRADDAGYTGTVDENLLAGVDSGRRVIETWMLSGPHCESVVAPAAREVGVGYARYAASDHDHYWTVDFGAP